MCAFHPRGLRAASRWSSGARTQRGAIEPWVRGFVMPVAPKRAQGGAHGDVPYDRSPAPERGVVLRS
eukprot:6117530-Lingulodinium_polyedra.AAC.1